MTDESASGGAAERARAAATTTAEQGQNLAATAKEEAQNVAGAAAEQARGVMDQAVQQVGEQMTDQATTQRDKLSETLHTFSEDLEQMVSQGPGSGLAADLAREVSDRARAFSSHLQDREPGQLLDDVRQFARRRPGAFLLGALAGGVVAGRIFRATADGAAAAGSEPAQETRTPVAAPGFPDVEDGFVAGTASPPAPGLSSEPYSTGMAPNIQGATSESTLGTP